MPALLLYSHLNEKARTCPSLAVSVKRLQGHMGELDCLTFAMKAQPSLKFENILKIIILASLLGLLG